jgi:transposase-like protein
MPSHSTTPDWSPTVQITITNLIDDVQCYQTVRELRWPDGITCPSCASQHIIKRGFDDTESARQRYECHDCDKRWKRNKKVAIKLWLRRLTGPYRAMELVASFANQSHLLEAGESTEERTSTPLGAHAHARPHPRHSMPRLSLPAPLDGHAWATVPPLLSSRRARIGALDRDAQQPFCYASRGSSCLTNQSTDGEQ